MRTAPPAGPRLHMARTISKGQFDRKGKKIAQFGPAGSGEPRSLEPSCRGTPCDPFNSAPPPSAAAAVAAPAKGWRGARNGELHIETEMENSVRHCRYYCPRS